MSDIIQSTTQQFLDIYDITNNFVIMKDGTVSTIITVDAMNFGLLAEEEQDAIMYAYAGLLNSLNYSVQIIIHSQTKDVTTYLKLLQEQELQAETETMRRRIKMYRDFVGNLIHERNVLDKKFYVVIPATALEMGFLATSSVLPGSKAFDISSVERSLIIEKAQNLLDPKRDHMIAQFARIGLFSRQLSTQEIIQLFYIRYNPESIEGQQIAESSSYSTPLVKASIQETIMNSAPVATTPATAPGVQTDPNTAENTLQAQVDNTHVQPLPEIHVGAGTEGQVAVAPADATEQATPTTPPTPTQDTVPSTPPAGPTPASPTPTPPMPQIPPTPPAVPPATPEVQTPPAEVPPTPAPVIPDTAIPGTTPPVAPMVPPAGQNLPPTPQIPTTPTPPAPPAAPSTPSTPPAPTAEPSTPAATAPAESEQAVQADLNAAVQSLGATPAETAPAQADTTTKKDDSLPPLPEI